MKVPLKRRLKLFPKLRRRLSSVRWTLLLITTAMFFLSAASTGCPAGGYTLSVTPNSGPSVQNAPPPSNNPPPPPSNNPPPPQPTANVPGITPILIPTIPGSPVVGSPASGSPIANPPPKKAAPPPPGGGNTVTISVLMNATGFVFDKPTMTITKSTTVTWVRGAGDTGVAPHTITCGTAADPKAGDCAKDAFNVDFPVGTKMVSRTFSTAGTYTYLCSIHPTTMIGTITVTP